MTSSPLASVYFSNAICGEIRRALRPVGAGAAGTAAGGVTSDSIAISAANMGDQIESTTDYGAR